MGILNDLLKRVQNVNEGLEQGGLIHDTVIDYGDDIMELQYLQLFQGLSSSGEDIRPYYSEDLKPSGYFYTVQAAENYAAWKTELDYPYSVDRNPDAPNLYINGRFHSELGVEFGSETVAVVPETNYAQTIVDKYGIRTFGLMMSNWMVIFQERGGYDKLMNNIKEALYV